MGGSPRRGYGLGARDSGLAARDGMVRRGLGRRRAAQAWGAGCRAGCDGTVTGWLGAVTETFAVAVPPLCWPTMVKYSAGPARWG